MFLHLHQGSSTTDALVNVDHVSYIDVTSVAGGYKVEVITEAVSTRTYQSVTTYASSADAWVGSLALVQPNTVDAIKES